MLIQHQEASKRFVTANDLIATPVSPNSKSYHPSFVPQRATKEGNQDTFRLIDQHEMNMGVLLHAPLIDVDVDNKDDYATAIACLDYFLPYTIATYGRASRPRSHRLYLLKDSLDGYGAQIKNLHRYIGVEVRQGYGSQSILPGSVHPSGEHYEWEADPLRITQTSMAVVAVPQILRRLTLAALAYKTVPYWVEGERNGLNQSLVGCIYWANNLSTHLEEEPLLSEQDVLDLVRGICRLTGDDEETNRLQIASRTWLRGEQDKPNRGWADLKERTGSEELRRAILALISRDERMLMIDEALSRHVVTKHDNHVVDLDLLSPSMPGASKSIEKFTQRPLWIGSGDRRMELRNFIARSPLTTEVYGIDFAPGKPRVFENPRDQGRMYANLWNGFLQQPYHQEVTDEDVEPFLYHLREVITANQEEYDWVLQWFASIFQRPDKKVTTALVLTSRDEGTGKTFLVDQVFGPILGRDYYTKTASIQRTISSQFNASVASRLLISVEEVYSGGRYDILQALKDFITAETMRREAKFQDAIDIACFHRLVFTTNNEEDAVRMYGGSSDRRYTVVKVNSKHRNDLDYFGRFREWLEDEDGHAKVFRYLLENVKVDFRFINRPLATEAKRVMQMSSWEPFDIVLRRMIERDHPFAENLHRLAHYTANGHLDGRPLPDECINRSKWPEWFLFDPIAEEWASLQRKAAVDNSAVGLVLRKRGIDVDTRFVRVAWTQRNQLTGDIERREDRRRYKTFKREDVEQYLKDMYGWEIGNEEPDVPLTDATEGENNAF